MKNKLNQLLCFIKKNDFVRIIIELVFFVSLFSINKYISLFFLVFLILEIIFSKKIENLLYIYLFLSFFDEVLILDIIKGSVSRIIMVLIFIKLLINIIKNKILPNKIQLSLILFFLIAFVIELFNNTFNIEAVSVLANIYIFILFSMAIKLSKDEKDKFIEKLFFTIVFAIIESIAYGFINNNFLVNVVDYEKQTKIYRFNGTYEPNFMCMYINLGILSLLAIKNKFNKYIFYIFMAVMINFAILTASITGIATLIVSIFIYIIINFKRKSLNYINAVIIIIFLIILFLGLKFVINEMNSTTNSQINTEINTSDNKEVEVDKQELENNISDNSLAKRITKIINQVKEGKLDDVTSGRIPLAKTFVKSSFNRPILNILFGNGITNKKLYNDFFRRNCYSHNSYLDFLYNFGIIGFILGTAYMIYKTFKNVFLNFSMKDTKYASNIRIIRIMLLIYALSLTLYTKRMFLIFFLM